MIATIFMGVGLVLDLKGKIVVKNIIKFILCVVLIMFFNISYGMFTRVGEAAGKVARTQRRIPTQIPHQAPTAQVPTQVAHPGTGRPAPPLAEPFIPGQPTGQIGKIPTAQQTISPHIPDKPGMRTFEPQIETEEKPIAVPLPKRLLSQEKIVTQPKLTHARIPLYDALISAPEKIASAIQKILNEGFNVYLVSSEALKSDASKSLKSFLETVPIKPLEWTNQIIDGELYASLIQLKNDNIITLARSEIPTLYLVRPEKQPFTLNQLNQYKDSFHIPHDMKVQTIRNIEDNRIAYSEQLEQALQLTKKDIKIRREQELAEITEQELLEKERLAQETAEKEAEATRLAEQEKLEMQQKKEQEIAQQKEAEAIRLAEQERVAAEEKGIIDLFDEAKTELEEDFRRRLEVAKEQLIQEEKEIDQQTKDKRQSLQAQFDKEKAGLQEEYEAKEKKVPQELNEKLQELEAEKQKKLDEIKSSEKQELQKIEEEAIQAKKQARLNQAKITQENEENTQLRAKEYEQKEAEIANLITESEQIRTNLDTLNKQKEATQLKFAQEKQTIEDNALQELQKAEQVGSKDLEARKLKIKQEEKQKIAALKEANVQEMKNIENELETLENKKIESENNLQSIKQETKNAIEEAQQATAEAARLAQERLEAEKKAEEIKKHASETQELQKQKDNVDAELLKNKAEQAQLNSQLELLNKDAEAKKVESAKAGEKAKTLETKIDLISEEIQKIGQELQKTKTEAEQARLQAEKEKIEQEQAKVELELVPQNEARLKAEQARENAIVEKQKIGNDLQEAQKEEVRLEAVKKQAENNIAQAKQDLDNLLKEQEEAARKTLSEIPKEKKEKIEQPKEKEKAKMELETPGGDETIREEKEKIAEQPTQIPFVEKEEITPEKKIPIIPIPPLPSAPSAQMVPVEKIMPAQLPPLEVPPIPLPEPIVPAQPLEKPVERITEIPPMPLPPVLPAEGTSVPEQAKTSPEVPKMEKPVMPPAEYVRRVQKRGEVTEPTVEITSNARTAVAPEPLATMPFEPTPFPREQYKPFQPIIPQGTWTSPVTPSSSYATGVPSGSYTQLPTFEPFALPQPSIKTQQEQKEVTRKLRPSLAAKILWEKMAQQAESGVTERQLPQSTKSGHYLRNILKDLRQKSVAKRVKISPPGEPKKATAQEVNPVLSFVKNAATTVRQAFNAVIDTIANYIGRLFITPSSLPFRMGTPIKE